MSPSQSVLALAELGIMTNASVVGALLIGLVPARVNSKWFHRALELGARVDAA